MNTAPALIGLFGEPCNSNIWSKTVPIDTSRTITLNTGSRLQVQDYALNSINFRIQTSINIGFNVAASKDFTDLQLSLGEAL